MSVPWKADATAHEDQARQDSAVKETTITLGALPSVDSNDDRSKQLHEMVARLDASGVDEALLVELQNLSLEDRGKLVKILFEREYKQQNP